jgi:hypothetical protein
VSETTGQDAATMGERTGDPGVDSALDPLAGLADEPLRLHVARFEAVHSALQDRLAQAEGSTR